MISLFARIPAGHQAARPASPTSATSPKQFRGNHDSVCAILPACNPLPRSRSSQPTPRHTALVRITHWITVISFCALLLTGAEIVISHPRFYWGETGNSGTPRTVHHSHPRIQGHCPHRLRLRDARPEWLEPLSPLRGGLGSGYHRPGLRSRGPLDPPLLAQPVPRARRSKVASLPRRVRQISAPRAAGRSRKPRLQRSPAHHLSVGHLRSVSPGDLDGPGLVSRLRFRSTGGRQRARRPRSPHAPCISSSPDFSSSFSSST